MTTLHESGCVCGLVRYRVQEDPAIRQICHCTFCQRRSGSAFATVAYFDERNVTFVQGELKQYQHVSDESGRWLRTEFCPACATTVTHTVQVRPGLRAIAMGTLDDPEWLTIPTPHLGAFQAIVVPIPEDTVRFQRRRRRSRVDYALLAATATAFFPASTRACQVTSTACRCW